MDTKIKNKIENAMRDCKLYLHYVGRQIPNGNYMIDHTDYDDDQWEFQCKIPSSNYKRMMDFLGSGEEAVIVVWWGEDSARQVADIDLKSNEHIFRTTNGRYIEMSIESFDYGIIVEQANGANVSMLLIPERFYPIAQFLELMDGGGKKPNGGLPRGVTLKDYLEYGKEVLNLELIHTGDFYPFSPYPFEDDGSNIPNPPRTRDQLGMLINREIDKHGPNCDLNWIDVSYITNMEELFCCSDFNGDISRWNVSNVTNMERMFERSKFNGDISKWDVSNVKSMNFMFSESRFNGDISNWNVSNVKDMSALFAGSEFNGDISKWNVSRVTDMGYMFINSKFNRDISNWDVSNVTDMWSMFERSEFNGDISKWDVSSVNRTFDMFLKSKFKGDVSKWNLNDRCKECIYSSLNKDENEDDEYGKPF